MMPMNTNIALSQLASQGIQIGIPRAISLEQHTQFPVVEVDLRSESLHASTASQFMETHTHTHVIWRISIDKFHLKDPFASKEWQLFLALFHEKQCTTSTIILSFGWEVECSYALLDAIGKLQSSSGLALFVDAEHYSWKTPKVQQTMQSLKLQPVFLDAPSLPGLIKDFHYHVGPLAILRCIGRNRKNWFEHHADDRFAYGYSQNEIREIADRILALKEHHEKILVTFCNRPSSSTVANAMQLGNVLYKNMGLAK
jgi:hypothetical protein